MLKITQLLGGRTRSRTQVYLSPELAFGNSFKIHLEPPCIHSFAHHLGARHCPGCLGTADNRLKRPSAAAPGDPASPKEMMLSAYPRCPILPPCSRTGLQYSLLSCFHASSISPLRRVIPNAIKHAIIFPILRKESFLHHAFLFPASLVLFPFTAKLLKRVTLLSPAPFLRCL